MTKYSWDIRELITRRKYIEDQLKLYEELFEVYDELIENYSKKYSTDGKIEVSCTLPVFYKLKQEFDNIPKKRVELLTDSIDVVMPYQSKLVEPNFLNRKFSDKELVEITRTLFKKLPNKYFLTRYDEFTNPNKCLLHIRNHRTLPTTAFGLTFTDPLEHISYGLISRHNSIQDIITLAHEIFHMIIRESEKPFYKESNKPIYVEVEGYFVNLLFSEMLKCAEDIDLDELKRFDQRDLNTTISTIKDCFIAEKGFELMNQNGIIDFDELSTILKSKNISTPVNNLNFYGFVSDEMPSDVNNATSYLVALDLFNQYNSDPEKVLSYLQYIPKLSGDEPKKELESIGVTFFEDGYKSLEGQCKQLLKKRNTTSK